MKKNYNKPNTQVITLTTFQLICQSTTPPPVETTTTPVAGSEEEPPGGWEPANARDHRQWDDEDEEDY